MALGSYGLCSHGLCNYGLCSCGLYVAAGGGALPKDVQSVRRQIRLHDEVWLL